MNAHNKPVFEAKLRQIRASVFRNEDKQGNAYFNTHLVRRYQSAPGEWSNSSHFTGEADLVLAQRLIEQVLEFIESQPSESENGEGEK